MSTGRRGPARRGRRSNYPYSPEIGEQIILDVLDGLSITEAAARAGIPYGTVNNWVTRGRRKSGPFEWRRFAIRLDWADAQVSQLRYQARLRDIMPETQDPDYGSRDLRID